MAHGAGRESTGGAAHEAKVFLRVRQGEPGWVGSPIGLARIPSFQNLAILHCKISYILQSRTARSEDTMPPNTPMHEGMLGFEQQGLPGGFARDPRLFPIQKGPICIAKCGTSGSRKAASSQNYPHRP